MKVFRIDCSFKFPVQVGVDESIVNAPRISCLNLTSLFALFVFLLCRRDEWCVHNRLFNTENFHCFESKDFLNSSGTHVLHNVNIDVFGVT
jgi:hypothetical protein